MNNIVLLQFSDIDLASTEFCCAAEIIIVLWMLFCVIKCHEL